MTRRRVIRRPRRLARNSKNSIGDGTTTVSLSILLDLMSRGINITIKGSLRALFWGQLLGGAFFLIGYLGGAGFSFFLCGRVGDFTTKSF